MSDLFDAILATLLPGEGAWPSAGTLGLAAALRADLAAADVAALERSLPPGLATLAAPAREDVRRGIETAQPDLFERLVTAAYTAYYVDPRVRAVIERETGYENRPPQPLGYELEPFDEALLEKQKQRAPFWRKA
jgi:hypothetical protein